MGFVIPDVILFVNGIPLVIIECKSPSLAETDDGGFWKPIESGINQLLRYCQQAGRGGTGGRASSIFSTGTS